MSELPSSSRLVSLDALRGFTIAAMVIVNDPGSWSHVYAPLRHAEWNGATPTDLIFPFFVFFVGVSITLSYTKQKAAGKDKGEMYKKILFRTLKIFGLGLFLWLWPEFDFAGIRYAGVLQRIALVFCASSILFLNTDWKTQAKVGIGLLLFYWIIMAYIPVPGIGAPDLSGPVNNWAHYIDSFLLPGRMWQGTWDPEGLFSTLPAIATGITGMLAGYIILSEKDPYKKLTKLFFYGFAMFLIGNAWNWFFPINKHIWTSSFVMYSSGLAAMGLAACILVVDIWGMKKWTFLGLVYGANTITSYVLAGMLTLVFYGDIWGGNRLSTMFMETATSMGVADKMASLMYALIYMLIIFIPALVLYRKKVFIKL